VINVPSTFLAGEEAIIGDGFDWGEDVLVGLGGV